MWLKRQRNKHHGELCGVLGSLTTQIAVKTVQVRGLGAVPLIAAIANPRARIDEAHCSSRLNSVCCTCCVYKH